MSMNNNTKAENLETWNSNDFEQLRNDLGRGGINWIRVWKNRPKIGVDLSGFDVLAFGGDIPNGLLASIYNQFSNVRRERDTDTEIDIENIEVPADIDEELRKLQDEDDAEEFDIAGAKDAITRARRTLRYQDAILKVLIRIPKYYDMKELKNIGNTPKDGLCIWDFSPQQRADVSNLLWTGVEGLEPFREVESSDIPTRDGDSIRTEAINDQDTAYVELHTGMVRRSDILSIESIPERTEQQSTEQISEYTETPTERNSERSILRPGGFRFE